MTRHDLTQPIFLEVDEIYNLACPASPIHYQYNPVKTVKTCIMGAIHMLGLAKRVKARILQASTSEVYGDPAVHPLKDKISVLYSRTRSESSPDPPASRPIHSYAVIPKFLLRTQLLTATRVQLDLSDQTAINDCFIRGDVVHSIQ